MHVAVVGWLKGLSHPCDGQGGIEKTIPVVCAELVRQHHQVTLLAPPGSFVEGCEVIEATDFVEATNIINCLDVDVVHDNTCWAIDSPVRQGIRHPHISVSHVMHAISYSHNVVYLSKAQRAGHAAQLGRDLCNSPVVPVPINPALKPVGLPRNDYLLFLGRVVECKGVLEAAKVAKLLKRTLIIAGPTWAQYASEIKDANPDVLFVGEVSGRYKNELLEQAWALMNLFNDTDGWSEPGNGTFGEAMAFSTPVAAFPNGCLQEQVINGQNGWMANNIDDIATYMDHMPYPSTFAPFQEQFSVENVVNQYVRLYERVISGSSWG